MDELKDYEGQTKDQIELNILLEIVRRLDRIADSLERSAVPEKAPDLAADLSEFADYPWGSIPAEVVSRDNYGPASVSYRGKIYTRRSPENKYGPAIWYSRCIGKDDGGENLYERLITFKELGKFDPEPLSSKVVNALKSSGSRPAPAAAVREVHPVGRVSAPANGTGRGPGPVKAPAVDYNKYFNAARVRGFTAGEARDLAELAGIDFKKAYKTTDYSYAAEVLELADLAIKKDKSLDWFINTVRESRDESNGSLAIALEYVRKILD